MARTADDYANAMAALMPPGRAWQFVTGTTQAATALSLSREWARVDVAASDLLEGSLPGNNADLLGEWEATLGLSDSIDGLTTAQRAAQIKAHFTANGGQSRPFLISFASSLGFTVTITSYARCRAGSARAGDPVYGERWAYVLGVKVLANSGGLPTARLLNALEEIVSAHVIILIL